MQKPQFLSKTSVVQDAKVSNMCIYKKIKI